MIEAYSTTDIGRRRQLNQDYIFSSTKPIGKQPNLFIVADGMGGHNAGDYASRHTTEKIVAEIRNSNEENPEIAFPKAAGVANATIREAAEADESLFGMGTTLVLATVRLGKYLKVANVGDSRLYVISKDTGIEQVTEDHSLVEEMIRMAGLPREEARFHPDKNIITRAIGVKDEVEVDIFSRELEVGDYFLMCSDGLTNMVDDKEIENIVLDDQYESLMSKGDALVRAANQHGGKDNIAVILVRISEDDSEEE